jgi:eukaryotic-like serine/threonine-protein kinase
MSPTGNDDARLDELLCRWEEARKRGETLTVELLCRDCPELADELALRIKALVDFELLDDPAGEPVSAYITAQFSELRLHARGGLGRIYTAFQAGLARYVALKFLREDRACDPEIVARFRREAEITARLEHPGIAPIYGLGRDEAGNLCYAMRFIEGKTLDQSTEAFYAERKLVQRTGTLESDMAFRGLIQRFKTACTTVAYAHSRGVLHRDLKPPNIMFGPFDETLVLDWGLGKIIRGDAVTPGDGEQEASCPSPQSEEIQTRRLIGTPGFMSPEQHAGLWDKVGPASDIYSLGATLYVLLTAKSPFEGCSAEEIATKVKQGEFTPPCRMNPDVPLALEAVCLKAMAFEPAHRYDSALNVAADLDNWLAGEPVTAWREPLLIQARRALARRRTLVWGLRAASILALLAVACSVVVLVWSNHELTRKNEQLRIANRQVEQARDRALGHFDVALRAIEHFHRAVSLNLDVKDRPDLKPLRTELLQAPLEFYRVLKQDLEQHAESRPEASARFADAVAGLAQITGEIDSEPNAIRAFQDAIDVLANLDRDHPNVAKYSVSLARLFLRLGPLQQDTNRIKDALASSERARSLYRKLADADPTDERYRFGLARAASQLGVTQRIARQPALAMASYQQSLVLLQNLVGDHPTEKSYQSELAHLWRNLGVLQRASNKPEEAMRSYQQARGAFELLVRDHPSVASFRQGLANSHFNIANLHIDAGRSDVVMDSLVQARKVQKGLVHDFPTVSRFQADLARVYGQIGAFLNFQGRQEESLENLQDARDTLVGLVRDHPEVLSYRVDLELTNYHIGCRHGFFGRYAQALDSLEQARDFFDRTVRENANDVRSRVVLAATWEDTGRVLSRMRRRSEAVTAYEQAILNQQRAHDHSQADAKTRGECINHLVAQHEELAEIYVRLNRPTEAIASLSRASELLKSRPNAEFSRAYLETRIYCRMIGLLSGRDQNLTAAQNAQREQLVDQALSAIRRAFPAGSPNFKRLTEDKTYDPLRANAQFQLHMLDLAFPTNPLKP